MSVFWPRHVAEFPRPAARLGRLAHYASFVAAAYVLWLLYDQTAGQPTNLRLDHQTASIMFLMAIGCVLVGRGIRWVLAGE